MLEHLLVFGAKRWADYLKKGLLRNKLMGGGVLWLCKGVVLVNVAELLHASCAALMNSLRSHTDELDEEGPENPENVCSGERMQGSPRKGLTQ